MTRLVVIGAGGFGRETMDVVEAMNSREPTFDLVGVIDDSPDAANIERLGARSIRYLGGLVEWLEQCDQALYAIAVGNPVARRRIAARLSESGLRAATLVHPEAVVGSAASIAPGAIVCAGAQVSTNVRLGEHVHLNPSVTVGHDSTIEAFASINPAATISGECTIESEVLIGAAAVVLQGLTVGRGCVVGAAACVVRDVPPGVVVKGVPAR